MNRTLATAASLSLAMLLGPLGCAGQTADDEASGESSSDLTASSNEHTAYSFFVAKGLTHIQSAAIVGNLMQESNVQPGIAQPGGPGRGIAQWSAGARWDRTANDNMKSFAAQRGESATSLNAQLEFIWYELQTFPKYGLARLRASTTLSSAVVDFQTNFEACGACNQTRRIQDAQTVLNAFGKEHVVDNGGGGATTGAGCFSPTLGKEMPANACVQSRSDGLWYQCDEGSWVDRKTVAAACEETFPL